MFADTRRIIPPLALVFLLNLVDWAMTADELALGMAKEFNPIGAYFFGVSPFVVLFFKLSVVSICCAVLFALRSRSIVYKVTVVVMYVFVLLVCWHIVGHILSI